jgi:hypothetical protein
MPTPTHTSPHVRPPTHQHDALFLPPDRLLDGGNIEAIRKLFRRLPKAGAGVARLQTLLFSATLHSREVQGLARELCQDPILVDLKGRDAVPDTGMQGARPGSGRGSTGGGGQRSIWPGRAWVLSG